MIPDATWCHASSTRVHDQKAKRTYGRKRKERISYVQKMQKDASVLVYEFKSSVTFKSSTKNLKIDRAIEKSGKFYYMNISKDTSLFHIPIFQTSVL